VAMIRDQTHLMVGFYALMVTVNVLRSLKSKKINLPIHLVPFVAGSVLFSYNIDAAYGCKFERLNRESQLIMKTEKHWFNQPIVLPVSLKREYLLMMEESNNKFREIGEKEKYHWATFSNVNTDEELLKLASVGTSPISKILHSLESFDREGGMNVICSVMGMGLKIKNI